jgi:uracil-DNA glycosylase family 4
LEADLQKAKGALCDECPLRDQPFVPTTGPPDAKIAAIGEGPGLQEVVYKRPFVGNSGKLLKSVLKHAGIDPERDVWYSNTVLCRPPDNETPTRDAIRCCSGRLEIEMHERAPQKVLALGGTAAKALLNTQTGIMALRPGPPRPLAAYNCEIIPTVHPAACLRSGDYFPFLVTDIGKINFEPSSWTLPRYLVPYSERTALFAIRWLSKFNELSVDIEVAVEKDLAFEHPSKYSILCIGIAPSESAAIVLPSSVLWFQTVIQALRGLLKKSKIIAQNGKFDIPGLSRIGNFELWFDTMLAHYCLDERGGIHGLKVMSREYLGAPDYAARIKQYTKGNGDFSNIPRDLLHEYNAYDATLTFGLYRIFERQLHHSSLSSLHAFLVQASNALIQVETEGVLVNEDYLRELDRDYQDRLSAQESALQKWVQNPRSPLQIRSALAQLGIETASTDVSHLQAILQSMGQYEGSTEAAAVSEFVSAILKYRKDQKTFGTYIKGITKRLYNGRVYPTYLLHGTTTGRLSCRNPNLQNIPRGSAIRRLFIASPENSLVQADYKQGELRVIACLSREQFLADIFNEKRDLLSEIARRFYGPNFTKEQRVRAKNLAYGSCYGAEPLRLTAYEGVTLQEAAKFQYEFFEFMPNVRRWQVDTREQVLKGNDLITAFGRHRRYTLITRENKKDILNECLAFVPQSTLSDICLSSLIRLVHEGFHPRITVHDSIVVECHNSQVAHTSEALSQILPQVAKETFDDYVPFPVDVKAGRSWGDLE